MITKQNKISLIIIIFAAMLLNSCGMNKEPVATISSLKNVKAIKISKNQVIATELNITSSEEIYGFLDTFKPSTSHKDESVELVESDFKKDGEIEIQFSGDIPTLIIDFDFDQGYRVAIKSNEYYDRFTYRTGRYLAERLSQSNVK